MRVIESESRQGAYIIVVLGLLAAYFGLYILVGILFVCLLGWFFFCSSRLINPTTPSAIVSPISGVITQIEHSQDSVTFHIKARRNGRIYAPSDLHNVSVRKQHGFYFVRQSALSRELGAREFLSAQTMLENENLGIRIEVLPRLLRACGLYAGKLEALFLEKIGFLNVGMLSITITGHNLKVLVGEKERVLGGQSALVGVEKVGVENSEGQ